MICVIPLLISRDATAQVLPDPVPDPNTIGFLLSGDTLSFDPSTGAYSASGRVIAVQFPDEILNQTDPLVLANSIVSVQGTFSGKSFDLPNIDTNGVFSLKTSITVDGTLVYSDVRNDLTFAGVFPTAHSSYIEWAGGTMTSQITDRAVIDSPFLNDWLANVLHDTTGPPKPKPDWECTPAAGGRPASWTLTAQPATVPEPSTLVLYGIAALCFLFYSWWRRGLATAKCSPRPT